MRKYKQVKRKEIIYSLDEWALIEQRAVALSLKTSTYIKRLSLENKITYYDMKEVAPLMTALRIIGGNINQIAKKANEINSLYADDVNLIKEEFTQLCHTLNQYLSELQSTVA